MSKTKMIIKDSFKSITFSDLENMIVFAFDSKGEDVFIDYAKNGEQCSLYCKYCGNPMIAKNGGTILRHHFAHANGSDCKKGHESQLPLFVKYILERYDFLKCPDSSISLRGPLFNSFYFYYDSVVLEKYKTFDLPIIKLINKGKKSLVLLVFFDKNEKLIEQIKEDETIESVLKIDLNKYKNSQENVFNTIAFILNNNFGKKWIKNPRDDLIKHKVIELASWKVLRKGKSGTSIVYCPISPDKTVVNGKVNSDCFSCPYSLYNIITNESVYFCEHQGCVGYLHDDFTESSILSAHKIDYSDYSVSSVLESFADNDADPETMNSEQLRNIYLGKTIKVKNHYNHKICLFCFEKDSNRTLKMIIKDGVIGNAVEYDPFDPFNSWHFIEEVKYK